MADRTLVSFEEPRLPDGPHWRLRVERSSAGTPGGLVVIEYEGVDGTIPSSQMTVVLDDLRRLQPALDWADSGVTPPVATLDDENLLNDGLATMRAAILLHQMQGLNDDRTDALGRDANARLAAIDALLQRRGA